jgi:hypothetical protein
MCGCANCWRATSALDRRRRSTVPRLRGEGHRRGVTPADSLTPRQGMIAGSSSPLTTIRAGRRGGGGWCW